MLSIDWGTFLSTAVSQKLPNKYIVLKEFWASESRDIEGLS